MGISNSCFFELRKRNDINNNNNNFVRLEKNIDSNKENNNNIRKCKTSKLNKKISISIKKSYKKKKSDLNVLLTEIDLEKRNKKIIKSEFNKNKNKIKEDIFENIYNIIKKKKRSDSPFPIKRAHLSNNENIFNKKKYIKGKLKEEDLFCKVYSGLSIDGKMITIKEYSKLSISKKKQIIKNKKKIIELNHPNIVKVISLSDDYEEDLNIIYESLDIDNFENIIKKYGTLNDKILQLYGKQLLQGLQYLHKNNIYHKNIKLRKILIESDGIIKIADSLIDSVILGNEKEIYNYFLNSNNIEYYVPPFFIKNIYKIKTDESIKINNIDKNNLNNTDKNDLNNMDIDNNNNEFWQSYDLWFVGCLFIESITGKKPWSHYNFKNNSDLFEFLRTTNLIPVIPKKISVECTELLQTLLNPSLTKMKNIYKTLLDLPFFKINSNNLTYKKTLTNISNSVKKSMRENNDSNNFNRSDSGTQLGQALANNKVVNILNSNNDALFSVSFSNEESSIAGSIFKSNLYSSNLSVKKSDVRNKEEISKIKIKIKKSEMPEVKEMQCELSFNDKNSN